MTKLKSPVPSGHVTCACWPNTWALPDHSIPGAEQLALGQVHPQETRERVVEAAKRLNYRPNYFARSLRRSKSMSVGVLAPDLSEGYFTRVMSGVVQELNRAHYFFFTACHYWDKELLERYPRLLIERRSGWISAAEYDAGRACGSVPVVAISAHNTAPKVTNIVLDHYVAAKLALSICMILATGELLSCTVPRRFPTRNTAGWGFRGCPGAGTEHGRLAYRASDASGWPLQTGQHPMDPQIAYEPTRALLEKNRDVTALFCFNDTAAMGAVRAIKDAGLDVPGDISVVGFDDITSAAFSTPSLTPSTSPSSRWARRAHSFCWSASPIAKSSSLPRSKLARS